MVIKMKGFLEYVPGNTILHKLNPITKIALSLLICISCFIGDNLFFLGIMICLNILIGFIGGIGMKALKLLKGLIKISIFLFILQVFFVRTGKALISLPLNIIITDDGIIFALRTVLRLIGATMPLALMLSLTQISDLSNALVKNLFIPYKYAFTFTTAIKFIPVFANEMSSIMEAQTARGVEFDTKNIFKKLRLILPLCIPLLVSSVRKTDENAMAAELRGFNLRKRNSGYKVYKYKLADILFILVGILLITVAILYF